MIGAKKSSGLISSQIPTAHNVAKIVIKDNPCFINPIYICPAPGIRENKNINILFFCLAIFFSFHNVFASPHLHAKRYFHQKHF